MCRSVVISKTCQLRAAGVCRGTQRPRHRGRRQPALGLAVVAALAPTPPLRGPLHFMARESWVRRAQRLVAELG